MKKSIHLKNILSLIFISLFIQLVQSSAQNEDKLIYKQRREILLSQMDGGIAIFKGAKSINRNGDVEYPFRQNSDVYYLTGLDEPALAFLLIPGEKKKFVMFVRQRNLMMEIWMGERAGIEGAMQEFGADTAFGIGLFEKLLTDYLKGKTKIYFNTTDKELVKLVDSLYKKVNNNIDKENINVNKKVAEMRVIKSSEEIELIKKACEITSEAQIEAMRSTKLKMKEYELAAIIEYIFKKNGAEYLAFPLIVGSGVNSTILHYEAGDRILEDGDMIVMDIGAEYKCYASDITRSIPANGKFSPEQKEIYDIVLKANKETIHYTKPGIGLNEIQKFTWKIISDGLYELGLITSKDKSWQTDVWMPHGTSHYVGLDVHDVGDAGYSSEIGRAAEPGMVFTIEPGIYINKNTFDHLSDIYGFKVDKKELEEFVKRVSPVVEKYKNIGIRIEDTIFITKEGCEVLSSKAPKEIDDIENLIEEKSKFKLD